MDILSFLQTSTLNTFKGFGNTLLNGFDSDLSIFDKQEQVGIEWGHFSPINQWKIKYYNLIDGTTGDKYYDEPTQLVRLKCIGLFAATWIAQPIGLTCNLVNKIAKIALFAHLWNPSLQRDYSYTARLLEWGKDLLVIVATPLLLVGMLFASLYGATLSAYDGRKLYATCERLAYSGGYQFFPINGDEKCLHNYVLGPCFQPSPKTHLEGF